MRPLAFATPEPADLPLILALWRCTDTEARDKALRLADEHCKASGHQPCRVGAIATTERGLSDRRVGDEL